MLFIICLIATIIFIILAFICDINDYDIPSLFSAIVAFATGVATVIMVIFLLITYIECPETEAKWQERYTSLNTRIENHMYYPWDRGDLIEEVQKWNENFAAQERSHNDFWVGIFNPESIEGLDKIDLMRIDEKVI